MSYRMLAWIPIAIALAFLVPELAMSAPSQATTIRVEVELAKVLWLAGVLAAVPAFERGDYLRRGWLLLAAAVALFLARDVTQLPFVAGIASATAIAVVQGALVIAGNAAQVAGVWVIARVWRAVGLEDDMGDRKRLLFAAAIVASAILTGPSLVHDVARVLAGGLDAVPHVASDLGDAASFVLLAAVVRTALALRGGVTFWVWSLFAAGQIAWMLFDGARTLTEHFGTTWLSPPLVECFRVTGALYLCAAGLAQRWVVRARFPVVIEPVSS